jgi:hypothetical protein
MEAVPLYDTSTAAWAKALIFSWISLFGVPEFITSDHGTQFTSNIWSHLCEMLHNSHRQTTAYLSNLAVKRLHRHLKDVLRARSAVATWSTSYLLYSLASVQSRWKTPVFPRLRQFLVPQLSCPTNFCKEMNFLLMQLLKHFLKLGCSSFFLAQAQFRRPVVDRVARRAAERPLHLVAPQWRCPASSQPL